MVGGGGSMIEFDEYLMSYLRGVRRPNLIKSSLCSFRNLPWKQSSPNSPDPGQIGPETGSVKTDLSVKVLLKDFIIKATP